MRGSDGKDFIKHVGVQFEIMDRDRRANTFSTQSSTMCTVRNDSGPPMIQRNKKMPSTARKPERVVMPVASLARLYRPVGPAAIVAALICSGKQSAKPRKPA